MAALWVIAMLFSFFSRASLVVAEESKCYKEEPCRNPNVALHLKLGAMACILVGSTIGVCLPIVGRKVNVLRPDNVMFFVIKAFASGVILATGFVHILPDAFESLDNPCLKGNAWEHFPFAGFIAMMAAVGSLMLDAMATGYYQRADCNKNLKVGVAEISHPEEDNAMEQEHGSHLHTHGYAHGCNNMDQESVSSLLRHRVISQVLELGILAHSIIIGVSLGASESPCTIRPLVAALTCHQLFEGMGLGGCIVQAGFKNRSTTIMAFLFSVTTPLGIAVGIAIASAYNQNSPTALIVEGLLYSASAGILIYMSLVDLLAADLLNAKMQSSATLQLWAYIALLLGISAMSLLARWA
ncbi:hypothetical protein SUGI_0804060 [Cryptomeria japonica]|uniref:zinc transporter 5 n=1 Tax=Cryptomeria japonica TaxID=3369 RepID=UPI0024148991|nr:zinc transporter 5 [Cryptomeria japonica]GLJ39374.1 hypothetical protein SUGI_0804060 [Cryptomeria japonica]